MATVFHTRPCCRFIELKRSFGRKNFHRTNQGSNFVGSCFSNGDIVRASIQFRKERQFQYLQQCFFFSRTNPSIFTLIAPELINQLNETSWIFQELGIASLGRSLMFSRKSVGTPALTWYSCEDFLSRTTQSHLLLRKDKVSPNTWPDIP